MMNTYPLYPEKHRKMCAYVMVGTVLFMLVFTLVFSYLTPLRGIPSEVIHKLVSFSVFFFGFYLCFSFFVFKTLVIEREKRKFYVCRTLMGKVILKKTYKLKRAKAVIVAPNPKIKSLYKVTLEGKHLQLFLGKGTMEFAEELGMRVCGDLGVSLQKVSSKKRSSK